jgi:hypothetical protein
VNYRDKGGDWQNIDTTLIPSDRDGYGWQNTADAFTALFPADVSTTSIRIEQDGQWLDFSLIGAQRTEASVGGSSVTYADVEPGVTIRYDVRGGSVKESITLSTPDAAQSLQFSVDHSKGLSLTKADDGSLAAIADGEAAPIFYLPAPSVNDQTDTDETLGTVSTDLAATDSGETLTLTPDPKWLADSQRKWPIVVDPTVSDFDPARDCHIYSGAITTSYCTSSATIKVGATSAGIRRSLIYFDPAAIPGTVIDDATLELYCPQDPTPPTAITVDVKRATITSGNSWKPWSNTATWKYRTGTTLWNNGNGGDFGSTVWASRSLSCGGTAGYKLFTSDGTHTIQQLVQGWVDDTYDNDGFFIKSASETTNTLLSFTSMEGTAGQQPILDVVSERAAGLEGGGFQNVIAVNPTDSNIVVSGGDVAGVSLSLDGGATWSSQSTGFQDQVHLKVASLEWQDASTLYALVGNGTGQGGVLRGILAPDQASATNGIWIQWTPIALAPLGNGGNPQDTTGLPHDASQTTNDDPSLPWVKAPGAPLPGISNRKSFEHPRSVGRLLALDASYVYVGSYNGGVYRAALSTILNPNPGWTLLGLNGTYIRSMAIDPVADVLYVSTYRGPKPSSSLTGHVYRISTPDGSPTVTELSSPVNVEELLLLRDTQASPVDTLYGVADERDGPASVYTESGIDYIDPSAEAGYKRGLFYLPHASTAAATTSWSQISASGRPDTSSNQIWYSLDGYTSGTNNTTTTLWIGCRNPEASGSSPDIALTRLSSSNNWSTTSTAIFPATTPSTDIYGSPGRSWWLAASHPTYLLGGSIYTASDISVAPTDHNAIFVAGRSGVWKSSDNGTSWAASVRALPVTINRQVLLSPTNVNTVDVGNTDYQDFHSTDGMETVVQDPPVTTASGQSVGLSLTRDPVSNVRVVGIGNRDNNINGAVWWDSGGTWQPIALPPSAIPAGGSTPGRPIGLLGVTNGTQRSIIVAIDQVGIFYSTWNGTTYPTFTLESGSPTFADSTLKRASLVWDGSSSSVYVYDKNEGIYRGSNYGFGGSATWTEMLHAPAPVDGTGYLATHPTNSNILYVSEPTGLLKITNATTATTATVTTVALAVGLISNPGPIDVDADGPVDSDSFASVIVAVPATSSNPAQIWSVNPGSDTTNSAWNNRTLDGWTAQPLIPLDIKYDPRNGTVYVATYGIGVYTTYLPSPGPV